MSLGTRLGPQEVEILGGMRFQDAVRPPPNWRINSLLQSLSMHHILDLIREKNRSFGTRWKATLVIKPVDTQ